MVEQASANAALAVAIAVLIGVAISFQSLLVIAGCCVAAAEAVFAVCFLVKLKRLDALPTTPGPGHDAKALMRKCIARITYSDDYLSRQVLGHLPSPAAAKIAESYLALWAEPVSTAYSMLNY